MVDFRFSGLIPVLLLGVLLSGCGLKTYPRPIPLEQIPPIQDLAVQVRLKTVALSWSVSAPLNEVMKAGDYRFTILKTELNWENRNCLECLGSAQEEAQIIHPARPAPAVRDGNSFVWVDKAVSAKRAYRYQVVVRDPKKQPLFSSNTVVAKVLAPPAEVKNLVATTEPRGIFLQWKPGPVRTPQDASSPGEVEFLVERHASGGAWEKLSSGAIRGNSFLDSGVASSQTYDYRVTPAYYFEDTLILGEPSDFRQAKAPEALPPPPPGTVWVIPVKGALEVHWIKSEGKVEGYHVYRREGHDIVRLTATPVHHPPYVDQAVRKNVVYSYAVSAVGPQADKKEGLLSKWAEIRSLMMDQ